MNNLSIIAAIGPNRELGYKNNLIWHIKEDLAFYKNMTMGKNVIMGRLTFESMPKVALIGRRPIVLTNSNIESTSTLKYFNNLKDLIEMIKNSNEEFMVIGGATIYKQFLPYVDTMFLTSIDGEMKHECDCYFPKFNIDDWDVEILQQGTEEKTTYQIKKYTRKK